MVAAYKPIYTVKEVAAILGTNVNYVYLLINTKELPSLRINNAKKINILSPDNDVFVKVKNDDKEEILPYTSLTDKEKEKLNNPNDKSITLDHTELKGMNIIELYDCKDTTMEQKDYKSLELPALLLFDYQDIYNSFAISSLSIASHNNFIILISLVERFFSFSLSSL